MNLDSSSRNPYDTSVGFEDDEEDIIRVTVTPIEAEFDTSAEETIKLTNNTEDQEEEQIISQSTISQEDIIQEASRFTKS